MSTIIASNLQASGGAGTAATLSSVNGGQLSGFRNLIINGNFDIWQRGTSASNIAGGSLQYLADRFCFESWTSTTARVTVDRVTDSPAISTSVGYSPYSARVTVTTTTTNPTNDFGVYRQFIEGYNAQILYQAPFVVRFWVKASVVGTYTFAVFGGGAGAGQTPGTPSFVQSYTINSANTWEYKTITIPACPAGTLSNWDFTNGRGLDIVWWLWKNPATSSGSLGGWNTGTYAHPSGSWVNLGTISGATWQITHVQVERGTIATPFERRPVGLELVLCQRYFEKSYATDVAVGAATGDVIGAMMNVAITTADFYTYGPFRFAQTKRAIPIVTMYNPVTGVSGGFRCLNDGTNNVATGAFGFIGHTGVGRTYATSNNMTSNYVYVFHYTASAELGFNS